MSSFDLKKTIKNYQASHLIHTKVYIFFISNILYCGWHISLETTIDKSQISNHKLISSNCVQYWWPYDYRVHVYIETPYNPNIFLVFT